MVDRMKWLLLIELCNPISARCEWRVVDSYRSQEQCVLGALMVPSINFKCKQRVESLRIPLPRARPIGPGEAGPGMAR
jgi:hypothetical protein